VSPPATPFQSPENSIGVVPPRRLRVRRLGVSSGPTGPATGDCRVRGKRGLRPNRLIWLRISPRPDSAGQVLRSFAVCGSRLHSPQGATSFSLLFLSNLASAYAELGQFDDAWGCMGEALAAIEITKERVWEAEVNRIAGEIALKSPEQDAAKGEAYFERALAVARSQQAKSWELRAAMSMARLWYDRGKRDEARDLLAPVYGWFTEGFDTLDLKEAKALLEELAA
jgi:tetratricopeptide (TPR) repeat protein